MTDRNTPPADFDLPPEVQNDLLRLRDRAERSKQRAQSGGKRDHRAENLYPVAINALVELKRGRPATHDLTYMPTYGDISDCSTLYIGLPDDYPSASHRIVFRDTPIDDVSNDTRREIVALGEREKGKVYHMAAQRLGRPAYMSLRELNEAIEPIARPAHPTRARTTETPPSPPSPNDELEVA